MESRHLDLECSDRYAVALQAIGDAYHHVGGTCPLDHHHRRLLLAGSGQLRQENGIDVEYDRAGSGLQDVELVHAARSPRNLCLCCPVGEIACHTWAASTTVSIRRSTTFITSEDVSHIIFPSMLIVAYA